MISGHTISRCLRRFSLGHAGRVGPNRQAKACFFCRGAQRLAFSLFRGTTDAERRGQPDRELAAQASYPTSRTPQKGGVQEENAAKRNQSPTTPECRSPL